MAQGYCMDKKKKGLNKCHMFQKVSETSVTSNLEKKSLKNFALCKMGNFSTIVQLKLCEKKCFYYENSR